MMLALLFVVASTPNYALYLPTNFTPDKQWPLVMGFHPGARGQAIVDAYRQGAEKYGYIVAASNTSRNGSWKVSEDALAEMSADVTSRYPIDGKRIYTTGLSGGARVALQVALGTGRIAGVIASSAAWPDGVERKSVPFAVFGTAGTEDFNYIEMRRLDYTLTSPHHVEVFVGGHQLPPPELATAALAWMQMQAMKSGLLPRDEHFIDEFLAQQTAAAGSDPRARQQLVADFAGLRVVAPPDQKELKNAIKKDRATLDEEERRLSEVARLEEGLHTPSQRADNLTALGDLLRMWSKQARADADSVERRLARRMLRGLAMSERQADPEFRKLIEQNRP